MQPPRALPLLPHPLSPAHPHTLLSVQRGADLGCSCAPPPPPPLHLPPAGLWAGWPRRCCGWSVRGLGACRPGLGLGA
eukprot:3932021-Rhodomonas_salina.1